MSLKVAELLATLTVDGKDMAKGVDDATTRAAKSMGKVVDAASKAGTDAGKELADGVEKGASTAGKKAADGVESSAPRMKSAGEKLGDSAAQGLASIEVAATKVSKSVADGLEGEQSKVRQSGEKLGKSAGEGLSTELNRSTAQLDGNLGKSLEDLSRTTNKSGQTAGSSLGQGIISGLAEAGIEIGSEVSGITKGLANQGIDAGQSVGSNVGQGMVSGLAETVVSGGGVEGVLDKALNFAGASPAALAAGAAVGAAFLKGAADAISHGGEQDILANRLDNLGGAGVGQVSAKLFRQAWGESTADVNAAIDAVYSTLAESRDSEAGLERLSTKALAFASVMEMDVGKAVSNAGVLIDTGLARNADEAFDLLTASAKRVPAGVRDELADATQEYSQFFAGLGFDGEEAFGVLVKAAEGGTYALDKAGDSIKEFRDKATDMSAATKVGYDILGLSQEEYTNKLLTGGAVAKQAYGEIMDAILSIEDPSTKSQAALAFFGDPLRDISGDAAKMDETLRSLASGGMEDVKGQADDLGDAFTNLDSSFTVVKRNILGFLEDTSNDALRPVAELLAPPSDDDMSNWEKIRHFFEDQGGFMGLFNYDNTPAPKMPAMDTKDWDTTYGKISDRYRASGEVIIATNRDVTTSVALTEDEVKAFGDQIDNLGTSGQAAGMGLMIAKSGADAFLQSIEDSTGLDDMLSRTTALFNSSTKLQQSIKDLSTGVDVRGSAEGTVGMFEDTAAVLGDVAAAGNDAQAAIAAALQYQGEEGARAKADELRTTFEKMFAGRPDAQVRDLLELMGLLPEQIDTAITISGQAEAITKLQLLRDSMTTMPKNLAVQVQAIIASGDYASAAELAAAYAADMQDGVLNNPLLIALNADPTQAEQTVLGFPAWASGQEQPVLSLGLDTAQAEAEMARMTAILNDPRNWFGPALPTGEAPAPATAPKKGVTKKKNGTKADLGRGNPNDIDNNPWTPYHTGGIIDEVPVGVEVPILALGGESVRTIAETNALMRPAPVRDAFGATASAAGGSSDPGSVATLAAEVRTLARAVARKGNTYHVNGAQSPPATAEAIDRKQRTDAWAVVG